MATHAGASAQNIKTELDVCLGKVGTPVGKLVFVRNGPRMFTQFAYFQSWLDSKETFNVSPDLASTPAYQARYVLQEPGVTEVVETTSYVAFQDPLRRHT